MAREVERPRVLRGPVGDKRRAERAQRSAAEALRPTEAVVQVHHLSVRSSGQAVDTATPTAVVWDTLLGPPRRREGFDTFAESDNQIVCDLGGELLLSIRLTWGSYAGGGEVVVAVLSGEVEELHTFGGVNSAGQQFTETVHLNVAAGAAVQVRVEQTSGANQDLASAELHASLIVAGRGIPQGFAAYLVDISGDDLAGYWRLGDPVGAGTAQDSSGNGLGGTYIGVTRGIPGSLAGDADTAARFNGSSAHVNMPDDPIWDMQFGGWSMFARISKGTLSPSQNVAVVYRGQNTSAAPAFDWMLSQNTGGHLSFYLRSTSYDTYSVEVDTDAPGFPTGEWHSVGVSWDGNRLLGYLDGVLVHTLPTPGINPNREGTHMNLGRRRDLLNDSYFDGDLDEVAVAHRLWTPAQHARLHELAEEGF